MNNVNLEKVCRTCIIEKEQLVNISTLVNCNGTCLTIIKILNSFICNEITENDDYPNFVCSDCLKLAIIAYNFTVQSNKSHLFLQEYVKNKSNKLDSEVKEIIDNRLNNNLLENVQSEDTGGKEEGNGHADSSSQPEVQNVISRRRNLRQARIKKVKSKATNKKIISKVSDDSEDQNSDLGIIYFCSQCNKSFKNKYIFNAHEKRHKFKGQFICSACGKGFSSQSCLNRHNKVHTGEKKYECVDCHKRFPSSNNLKLHSRIHTGHKPYLCTSCGKRFSHPTGLTYHMRTHTHEKPYCCELCGKRFAIQCHFERHKMTHSGERPFPCNQCGRAFIKKIDLQRHEEIHSGLKPHSCTICKKSFLRIKNLNYHMMLHTEERPHKCDDCGKGFIRSYYLKVHVLKHHCKETTYFNV